MNQLPVLKGKRNIQFTNPLAGFVYDNKKYAQSCFIQSNNEDQTQINLQRQLSNSIHSVFFKTPIASKMILNKSASDVKAQKEFRITKALNLSKRLSQNSRFRCTRNKWVDQQLQIQPNMTRRQPKLLMFEQEDISLKARQVKSFKFPEIKTLVLDVFYSLADIQKTFKINLKKYFQMFFSQSLSGLLFPQLIMIAQKYIKLLISKLKEEQEDCDTDSQVYKQNLGILSKYQLFKRLLQLEKSQKFDVIQAAIKAYCIPSKQLRTVYMNDLLSLASIQLYETFNCSKDQQYVLINSENGNIITDFLEISFSTNALFISEKKRALQNYQRYLQILKNGSKTKSKYQFRETLKHNFRQKVLKGNYDSNQQSPKPFRLDASQKKSNLIKAQKIVDVKNERNASPHQRVKSFTSQIAESKSTFRSKDKPDIVRRPKQQQNLIYSIDRKIQEQFRILKMKNDFTNTILRNDQSAKNKIEVSVLVNENIYFKNKSLQHINRILVALGFLRQGEFQRLNSSHLITIQQFSRMRKIINCIGEKDITINFVDRYLTYDQYGQLSKQNFRKTLNFIVGADGKTTQIILNTIWGWLQKNRVTTSTSICRKQMQLSYEKNKLVYYLLISLIFGTNQFTALDLATQTLF